MLGLLATGCLRKTGAAARAARIEPEAPIPVTSSSAPIYAKTQALGPGVNLGDALEAPTEGEWGVKLRDEDFTLVAAAGFRHVRIPVRWSAHALAEPPFTIEEAFAARVKWAVDSALAAGLRVVFNVHH